VLQIWRQSSLAEVRQGQQALPGVLEVSSSLRQRGCERLDHSLELSLHLVGVGLVDDGTHQGGESRAAPDVATVASRSRKLVGPTPLPGGPLATSPRSPRRGHGAQQRSRAPRRKSHRATSERQRASQPAASSLVATQTPRISEVPLARAAGDDEHVDVRGPASLSHLDHESIRQHDRVRIAALETVANDLHLRIEAVGHRARSGTSSAS